MAEAIEHLEEESNEPEVFTIPSWNMERLNKEVAKLNRRAEKLGFPLMTIDVLRKHWIKHPRYVRMFEEGRIAEESIPLVQLSDIMIIGDPVKIEGYDLMGTLDHYSIPGSVIVRTVPGQSIPEEFHDRDATCDHCGKKRYRIETFVLREEDTDNHIAVGRQCVRDFIGYNVDALARYLQRWRDLVESFRNEDDERWWGGRVVLTYNKESVLSHTFGVIRVSGWKARSACNIEDGDVPTSNLVANIFDPPQFTGRDAEYQRAHHRAWLEDVRKTQDTDKVSAAEAMEWLESQNDTNEYMHNLKVLLEADGIPMNMFGYWCSLASAYLRHQDRLQIEKAERKNHLNEWTGDLKERRDFTVEVVTIRAIDGRFGVVNHHKFIDDAGRTIIWWANADSKMKAGKTYKIKGTVKKHDEYKDWKQTVLSRVAVVEEVETKED